MLDLKALSKIYVSCIRYKKSPPRRKISMRNLLEFASEICFLIKRLASCKAKPQYCSPRPLIRTYVHALAS